MGATLRLAVLLTLGCVVHAQQRPAPVSILKQIDRHNEDGSYSYGYEAADGSFKIETKYPTGEVQGKYGYVDDSGKVREVEYGASARGFEPAGSGINVPPPTLDGNYVGPDGYDDGQYREDPSVYYKDERYNKGSVKSYSTSRSPQQFKSPAPTSFYEPEPEPQQYNPPPPPRPAARQRYYNPTPAPQYNPPAPQYNPPASQYNPPAPRYNPPAPQYNPPAPRYNPPAPQYNSPTHHYNPQPQQSYNRPPSNNKFNVDPSLFGSYSVVYEG